MKKTTTTYSFKETQSIAKEIIPELSGHKVIALFGDLGSGKTTFIQGLAKGLGITKKIISPTFIIMRTYNIPPLLKERVRNSFHSNFYHVDLYRIKSPHDIQDIGLLELIKEENGIFAIEWPEKIKHLLPHNTIKIYFEYLDENKRKITIIQQ